MIKDFAKTQLMIQNRKLEVFEGEMDHDLLSFFTENPRIYSLVCVTNESPSQEEILSILTKMEHVKHLVKSIKFNGGLTDPVIVKKDTLQVLEGNSRLAAYRILAQNDPIRWSKISVRVLPDDTSESEIFSLLGEYHVNGKKPWSPYEVANYVYRRHTKHEIPKIQIAKELSKTSAAVSQLISVIQFMVDAEDTNPSRWSYYDEYLKSKKIKKARQEFPNIDKVVIKQIKSNQITKATDIRDKLTKVVNSNSKNLKKYVDEERDLDTAYESAIAQGADTILLNKLRRTKDTLADTSLDQDLKTIPDEILQKCGYEIKRISKRLDSINTKIEKILQRS